jgi:STE24 endopeptidase
MAHGAGVDRTLSSRTIAWWLVLAGGAVFCALAAFLVPWQPVPGGSPDPVSASSVFSAGEIARAEDYARTARLLAWSSLGVSLVVAAALGFTSRGARLLGSRRLPWPVTVLGLVFLVLLIGRLATLPLSWMMREQRLEHDLTRQGLAGWIVDQLLSFGVGVLFTTLGILVVVGCARRWPTWWPVVAAGLSAALVVIGSFLYPVLVEPVFNDFVSMPDSALRSQILALADEEGVTVDDVLVADASKRTTTLNAYVSGFGDTRRVVVYDNLVDSLPDDQALSVIAHELAHARHGDVLVGTALGAAGSVLGVGLLALILGSHGVRRRAGVTGMSDPRVVALLLALGAFGALAASPLENGISRRIETRADVDALKATGDPVAFEKMQRRLAVESLADPTPPALSQFWFGSHPTVLGRVALARGVRDRR